MPAFCVFAEDINFDVEWGAGLEGVEAGGGVGVGDDRYLNIVALDGRYGETDAFDGDGALRDDVAGEGVGELDVKSPVGVGYVRCDWREGDESCGSVYVALNDVASERRTGGGGKLQIDDGVGAELRERGASDRFGSEVGREAWGEGVGFDAEGGEADAVDRDAVAGVEACGERGGCNGDAGRACGGRDGEKRSGGLDQSSKHGLSLSLSMMV